MRPLTKAGVSKLQYQYHSISFNITCLYEQRNIMVFTDLPFSMFLRPPEWPNWWTVHSSPSGAKGITSCNSCSWEQTCPHAQLPLQPNYPELCGSLILILQTGVSTSVEPRRLVRWRVKSCWFLNMFDSFVLAWCLHEAASMHFFLAHTSLSSFSLSKALEVTGHSCMLFAVRCPRKHEGYMKD